MKNVSNSPVEPIRSQKKHFSLQYKILKNKSIMKSNVELLSDADNHVKTILSHFLLSIEPEDKAHLDIDHKIKQIKESK